MVTQTEMGVNKAVIIEKYNPHYRPTRGLEVAVRPRWTSLLGASVKALLRQINHMTASLSSPVQQLVQSIHDLAYRA